MEKQDIEYNYIVNGISDNGVAVVTYVPLDDRLSSVERNVSIPLHKAKDKDHVMQMVEQKIRGRAPIREWEQALMETQSIIGKEAAIGMVKDVLVGCEQKVRNSLAREHQSEGE